MPFSVDKMDGYLLWAAQKSDVTGKDAAANMPRRAIIGTSNRRRKVLNARAKTIKRQLEMVFTAKTLDVSFSLTSERNVLLYRCSLQPVDCWNSGREVIRPSLGMNARPSILKARGQDAVNSTRKHVGGAMLRSVYGVEARVETCSGKFLQVIVDAKI